MTRAGRIAGLVAALVLGADAAEPKVTIRLTGEYRLVISNGWPNHATGRFPSRDNPNAIAEKNYVFRLTLKPQVAAQPTPTGYAWFGVALNGVPFEPGTAEAWKNDQRSGWNIEAIQPGKGATLGLDSSNAHVQPNGQYHYHGMPEGEIARLGKGTGLTLVAWARDGFPIYARYGYIDANNASSGTRVMRGSWQKKATPDTGRPSTTVYSTVGPAAAMSATDFSAAGFAGLSAAGFADFSGAGFGSAATAFPAASSRLAASAKWGALNMPRTVPQFSRWETSLSRKEPGHPRPEAETRGEGAPAPCCSPQCTMRCCAQDDRGLCGEQTAPT